MKKFDKKTIKGFAAGVLTAVLVGTTILPAAATTMQNIKVAMGGISIYIDGNLKKPTDANGNAVEPLIYNGTTYLPLRALTNMLTDKEVGWDGDTMSVYIGKQPNKGEKSVTLETLEPFSISWCKVYTGKDAQFNLLDETVSPFNALKFKWTSSGSSASSTRESVVYKLNSDYSSIHGYFVEPYTYLGDTDKACIQFYSVDQYGEKTLIKTYNTKAADAPVEISVPLYGVNILRIEMAASETSDYGTGCFYDVTLTTAP